MTWIASAIALAMTVGASDFAARERHGVTDRRQPPLGGFQYVEQPQLFGDPQPAGSMSASASTPWVRVATAAANMTEFYCRTATILVPRADPLWMDPRLCTTLRTGGLVRRLATASHRENTDQGQRENAAPAPTPMSSVLFFSNQFIECSLAARVTLYPGIGSWPGGFTPGSSWVSVI